jgi:hypothetical protein
MQAKLHFALPDFGESFPLFVSLNFSSMSVNLCYAVYL